MQIRPGTPYVPQAGVAPSVVESAEEDVDDGVDGLLSGEGRLLDDELVEHALDHPGEGEGHRLGGERADVAGGLLGLDAVRGDRDEAADERMPEGADLIVVGRDLDDDPHEL